MKKLVKVLQDDNSNTILFCNKKNKKLYAALIDKDGRFDSISGVYDGEGNHVLYNLKLDAFNPEMYSFKMLFKLIIDSKTRKYFYNLKNKYIFVFNGRSVKKVIKPSLEIIKKF